MPNPEKHLGVDQKPSLIIPGLTRPYGGVTDEVDREYIYDPSAFLNKTRRVLLCENPSLGTIFERSVRTSPVPEYSQKWALIYYEIFSRSGRKANLPLACFVDGKSVETIIRMEVIRLVSSERREDYINGFKKARSNDEEMSDELRKFWENVDRDTQKLEERGYSELEIDLAKTCLMFFQIILQRNNSQYSVSAHYSKVNPLESQM